MPENIGEGGGGVLDQMQTYEGNVQFDRVGVTYM